MTTELEALRAERDALAALVERQREVLESIYRYGYDTLSGPLTGPDDRAWQRAAVLKMAKRAREALDLTPPAALAEHDAELRASELERIADDLDECDETELSVAYVVDTLRVEAARIRAGAEGEI